MHFRKTVQATNAFIMPIPSSVRMEQLGSHLTDFDKIWY